MAAAKAAEAECLRKQVQHAKQEIAQLRQQVWHRTRAVVLQCSTWPHA